ncbi:MAG TPA: hypothetical protein VHU41_11420, partial [Thermoanaerobaculia bacterium]|nr:hypothetical protein [Thermoanaerobaculia bacterium]
LLGDPTMRHTKVMTAHGLEPAILPEHRPWIYLIYGAGFTAIFLVFALLYRYAYSKREKLELNEFETWETQHSLRRFLIAAALGTTYLGVALLELIPKSNKMAINVASVLLFGVVIGLFLKMMHMRRQRGQKKREWQAKDTGTPHEP